MKDTITDRLIFIAVFLPLAILSLLVSMVVAFWDAIEAFASRMEDSGRDLLTICRGWLKTPASRDKELAAALEEVRRLRYFLSEALPYLDVSDDSDLAKDIRNALGDEP